MEAYVAYLQHNGFTLAGYYEQQCALLGCHFADAAKFGCEFNKTDYMHLTKKDHALFAEEIHKIVSKLV